jgi:hypothetical protein
MHSARTQADNSRPSAGQDGANRLAPSARHYHDYYVEPGDVASTQHVRRAPDGSHFIRVYADEQQPGAKDVIPSDPATEQPNHVAPVQNVFETSPAEAEKFENAHPLVRQAALKELDKAGFPPSAEDKNPFHAEYWAKYTPEQVAQGQAHLKETLTKLEGPNGADHLKEILGLSASDWTTQAGSALALGTAMNQFQLELTKALIEILKSIGNLIAKAASPH